MSSASEDIYRQVGLPVELSTERPEAGPESPLMRTDGVVVMPPGCRPMPIHRVSEAPEPERREYVLEGIVPKGAATSFYGDGGVAKSLLAMSLCVSVAGGKGMWMGKELDPCACLYLDFELTAEEQVRRALGLCRAEGESQVPEELYYASALGLDTASAFWNAYEALDAYGIGLMVVDSFGLAMQGEATDAGDVIAFYRKRLEPFVREGVAVLLIDHQAKGGDSYQRRTSFGSVYKRNLVRSEVQIEALEQDESSGTLDLVFRHTKHNFGPRLRPFGARVGFFADEIQVGPSPLDRSKLVVEEGIRAPERVEMAMEDLPHPITIRDIADRTQMNIGTVKNVVAALKRKGRVRPTGDRVGTLEALDLVVGNPVVSYVDKEETF